MINPAAVTLLVGIFTFSDVVVSSWHPAVALAKAGTDSSFLQEVGSKGISKIQLRITIPGIFTPVIHIGGDKTFVNATMFVFYTSFM